jgi:hypothetical protein
MARRTITIVFEENLTDEQYAARGNGIWGALKIAYPAGGFASKATGSPRWQSSTTASSADICTLAATSCAPSCATTSNRSPRSGSGPPAGCTSSAAARRDGRGAPGLVRRFCHGSTLTRACHTDRVSGAPRLSDHLRLGIEEALQCVSRRTARRTLPSRSAWPAYYPSQVLPDRLIHIREQFSGLRKVHPPHCS